MDLSESPTVPRRLHYMKCSQCRKDKKKCLPLNRSWPGERCDRCVQYDYGCSASTTARQDREQKDAELTTLLPPLRLRQPLGDNFAIPNLDQPNYERPRQQANGEPSWPKCAPYFSNLIRASWQSFDPTEPSDAPLDMLMIGIVVIESALVYRSLKTRLFQIDIARNYEMVLQWGLPKDVLLEEYKALALVTTIHAAEKSLGAPTYWNDFEMEHRVLTLNHIVTMGKRWKNLLDAVGVPEVLLINYENLEVGDWEDIPLPEVESVSDEEWSYLLPKLLSPTLGLKETCLRLSGVAEMIKHLKGLKESVLKEYLADNIEQRVHSVLGTEKNLPGYMTEPSDDDSMADADYPASTNGYS